jgi:acetolactate synthase-1/2/3 large subunit
LSAFFRAVAIFVAGRPLGQPVELWLETAALSERDYIHEAIDRADLILSIGHDTVEKPPFLMGPGGPTVIHIGYTPPNIEEVYFPHASVVGDIGPSLTMLADQLGGDLPNASALLPLRDGVLAEFQDPVTSRVAAGDGGGSDRRSRGERGGVLDVGCSRQVP